MPDPERLNDLEIPEELRRHAQDIGRRFNGAPVSLAPGT